MKPLRGMPFLAARVFGTPLAIWKPKLEVILTAVGERILGREVDIVAAAATEELNALLPAKGARPAPESMTQVVDGVAMIDLNGSLVHRSSWMDAMSGLASYESLSEEFDRAIADSSVKAVLLCLNSPGGEVSGMFEMAERINAARKGPNAKPVYAIASDMACSAAYLLGAACEKLYATEGAVTGSVGIVMAHMDVSEADKKAGIKVTYIASGARKVDGNPHEPLTGDAKASIEHHVMRTAEIFHARVDNYRGLAPGAARSLEAAVFVGADAEKVGLIDGVRSTRQVLAELKSSSASQRTPFLGGGSTAKAAITETKEPHMDLQQALAALEAAKNDLLAKDKTIAKLEGRVEALTLTQREAIVDKHIRDGVAPAMRGSAMKLAATCSLEELDAELASWPRVTRPNATGKVDAVPPAEAAKGVPAIEQLNAKAKEIQAATPGLAFPDAFDKACRANPELFKAHREANPPRASAKKS